MDSIPSSPFPDESDALVVYRLERTTTLPPGAGSHDWPEYFAEYNAEWIKKNAARAKIQIDDKGNPIEPELELEVIVPAEPIEGDSLPRSAKAYWKRVQTGEHWTINGQYSETMVAATRYAGDAKDGESHKAGDQREPAHERAHIWLQGVFADDVTMVAAFVIEYELNTNLKAPAWKFISATYGDIVATPKEFTKKATEFDSWLSVFLPKRTEKK